MTNTNRKRETKDQKETITQFFSKKPVDKKLKTPLQVIDPPSAIAEPAVFVNTDFTNPNDVDVRAIDELADLFAREQFSFKIPLNEEQKQAATQPARKPVMILAGAGTGKTTTLLARVYSMVVHQQVPAAQILVVTFTNKAAKELMERLTDLCPTAADCTICTFHSFCYKLLSRYYKPLGFKKRPTVLSSDAQILNVLVHCYKWVKAQQFQEEALEKLKIDVDRSLYNQNSEQQQWMQNWERIFEVVKVRYPDIYLKAHEHAVDAAGLNENKNKKDQTGKSNKRQKVAGESHKKLNGTQSQQTQSSSSQQQLQIQQQSQNQQQVSQNQQNHENQNQDFARYRNDLTSVYSVEFIFRLRELLQIKLESVPNLKNVETNSQQWQKNFKQWRQQNLKHMKQFCQIVKRDIDHLKTQGEGPNQALGIHRLVFQAYQHYLKQICAVDFNDMVNLAVKLFDKDVILSRPDGTDLVVPALICGRYKFLLVDEFQDCNRMQLELVKKLQQLRGNVTVVGDDAQSIYGFRGSYSEIFKEFQDVFQDDFKTGEIKFPLEINYRSRPAILKAGSSVIEDSILEGVLLEKQLIPSKEENGLKIKIWSCGTSMDEAEVVAEEMQRLHTDENIPYEGMISLNRCFKFGRAGKTHEPLQLALTNLQIPYTVVKDLGIFEREISLDICAYLTLICDQDQDDAFLRIVNKPTRQLGKKFIEKIQGYQEKRNENSQDIGAQHLSLMEVSKLLQGWGQLSNAHNSAFTKFVRVINELRYSAYKLQVDQVIEEVLEKTGLFQFHKKKKRQKNKQEEKMTSNKIEIVEDEDKMDVDKDEDSDYEIVDHEGESDTPNNPATDDDDDNNQKNNNNKNDKQNKNIQSNSQNVVSLVSSQQQSQHNQNLGNKLLTGQKREQGKTCRKYDKLVNIILEASKKFVEQWKPQIDFLGQMQEEISQSEWGDSIGVYSLKRLALDYIFQKMSFRKLEQDCGSVDAFGFICEQSAAVYKCGLPPLADFVAHTALAAREPPENENGQKTGGVRISTIHAAKGLEYDAVFIVRCNESFFPTQPRASDFKPPKSLNGQSLEEAKLAFDRHHDEEEKRLAHVALTRAKEKLYMTYIRVLDQGGYKNTPEICEVSRFVEKLMGQADYWVQEETFAEAEAMEKIDEKEIRESSGYGGFVRARDIRDAERAPR